MAIDVNEYENVGVYHVLAYTHTHTCNMYPLPMPSIPWSQYSVSSVPCSHDNVPASHLFLQDSAFNVHCSHIICVPCSCLMSRVPGTRFPEPASKYRDLIRMNRSYKSRFSTHTGVDCVEKSASSLDWLPGKLPLSRVGNIQLPSISAFSISQNLQSSNSLTCLLST